MQASPMRPSLAYAAIAVALACLISLATADPSLAHRRAALGTPSKSTPTPSPLSPKKKSPPPKNAKTPPPPYSSPPVKKGRSPPPKKKTLPPPPPLPLFGGPSDPINGRTLGLQPFPTVSVLQGSSPNFRYGSVAMHLLPTSNLPVWDLKKDVDWRRYLNTAEDQDKKNLCAACWAFAAATALEGAFAAYSKRKGPPLSVQQLVDCGQDSCSGGFATDAWAYALKHPLTTDRIYPYVGSASSGCNKTAVESGTWGMEYFEHINFFGYVGLMLALQFQPVVVTLEADQPSFSFYDGKSIYNDTNCFANQLVDHTVVLVGYHIEGPDSPNNYFILRNSWGTEWGDKGYMYLAMKRTPGGMCGILSQPAYYPIVPPMPGQDPCILKPCGGGICTPNGPSYDCDCSNRPFLTFVPNLKDGNGGCVFKYYCKFQTINPCGVGLCQDDGHGGYDCSCPFGYLKNPRSDGTPYCALVSGALPTSYISIPGDNCLSVSQSHGLTPKALQAQNPGIDCTRPLTAGTVLNVTTTANVCAVQYPIKPGDTCASVASTFGISLANITALNPGLSCNSTILVSGNQLCVKEFSNQDARADSGCGTYVLMASTDTCASIRATYNLSATDFYALNPGFYCDRVNSQSGQQVCVAGTNAGLGTSRCKSFYFVQSGDTCLSLVYLKYSRSSVLFKSYNGFACINSNLYKGQALCISK